MKQRTYYRPGVGKAIQNPTRGGYEWSAVLEFSAGELRDLADLYEDANPKDLAVPELRALCDMVNELNGR